MALNRPLPIDPSSPFDDHAEWRKAMEQQRQLDKLQREYGGQIPTFSNSSQPDVDSLQQVVVRMVDAEIKRFDAARKAMNATIEGLSEQVSELRRLYDYVYKYHPEVIGEFDVVQRAKERIK